MAVSRAYGGMVSTNEQKLLLFGGQTNDLQAVDLQKRQKHANFADF